MEISGLNNLTSASTLSLRTGSGDGSAALGRFDRLLQSAVHNQESVREEVRSLSQQLVSTTLVAPLLGEVRSDPFRTELFHGGMAEDMFRQQLDTILADRITRKADMPIVQTIYERIMTRINAGGDIGGKLDDHG